MDVQRFCPLSIDARLVKQPHYEGNVAFVDELFERLSGLPSDFVRSQIPFWCSRHLSELILIAREEKVFRVRVAGARFSALIGMEISGRLFGEAFGPWSRFQDALSDCCSKVLRKKTALAVKGRAKYSSRSAVSFEIAILPVGNDQDAFTLGRIATDRAIGPSPRLL